MKKRIDITLWSLLGTALIIKLGYLFFALEEPSSVGYLSIDALYHYKWASLISSGDFLANTPYFRAPLYPFILALLLKIAGGSLVIVRVIQVIAGCLTLFYAYRIAFKIAGKPVAVMTVLILLLYPVTTYYDGELLLDSLFTLFALISLYYFVEGGLQREHPFKAGLFFALGALTRPTIIVFLPVVAIYYLRHWKTAADRKAGIKDIAKFLIVTALLIAPVTVINYIASDQFILISYQGGINFYIGNNPEADGLSSTLPEAGKDWDLEDADYLAFRDSGRRLRYGEQSFFWYKKGFDFIINNPASALGLFLKKFYYLFSGHEISNNRPLDEVIFNNKLLAYFPIRFSLMLSLAILPVFLVHENRKNLFTLYGLIILYGAAVSMFFVSTRFRLPIVPLIAVTAAWGIAALWETLASRRIDTRLFLGVAGAVVIYIMAATMLFPISLINPEQSLFLRGNQSLRRGEYQTAIARFDSLAQQQPNYENCHLNLGITYLKLGKIDQAEDGFRKELFYNSGSAEAANNLGVVFLLRHEYDSARYYCRRALDAKPYYTEAAVNFLRSVKGETDPGILNEIENFRREIRPLNQDKPPYIFEEALYFSDHHRYSEAIDNQLRILEILSRREPSVAFDFAYHDDQDENEKYQKLAAYQLGYLYGLSGEFETSIRFSRQAIALDQNLKEAYINLISGYRSLGEIKLADSVAALYLSRWPDQ